MIAYVTTPFDDPRRVKIHADEFWIDNDGRLIFGKKGSTPLAIFEKGGWVSMIRTSALADDSLGEEAA